MKKLFFALLLASAFSCSEDLEPVAGCDVDNVFEIPWLAKRIKGMEKSEIDREYTSLLSGQYGSQTVFVFDSCCPRCFMMPPAVYDCSGKELGRMDTIGEDVQNLTVIWEGSEFSCGS